MKAPSKTRQALTEVPASLRRKIGKLEQSEADREKAEEALRESERRYREFFSTSRDCVFITSKDGKWIDFNDAALEMFGYDDWEELFQVPVSALYVNPEERTALTALVEKQGYVKEHPVHLRRKDGAVLDTLITTGFRRSANGSGIEYYGTIRDITQSKRATDALRESEELYTKLVDSVPDIIVRSDLDGRILFINDYALQISGYSRAEIEGQHMLAFIAPEDRERAMQNTKLILQSRIGPREYKIIMKNGREIPFEVNGDVLRNEDGTPFGIVNVCRDISERRRTERSLRENEGRLRGITQNLPGAIFQFHVKDSGEYRLSYISERLIELYGFPSDLDAMLRAFLDRLHEEDRDRFIDSYQKAVQTATPWNFEGRIIQPSGEVVWFQGLATPTRNQDQLVFDGLLLNITERKQAEEMSRQSEEKFHKVFMTTPDCIAIARISDGLLIDANKGYEDILGWKRENVIGEKLADPRFNFWVDLSARDLMLEDLKDGRDVLHRELKFRRCDGSVRTGIYSARSIHITGESCLIFILQDITNRKREEEEFRRTVESLRNAVGVTIQVMVTAVEARDPYTAGHQIRAADLARAIATEMGLSQDRIDGIRMAGAIHDIGKLSIPAEILSKPTQLTELEFSLIKEHPRKGYEMLKDVESPWPLAQIVYQHHERMDGSGYPGNLKRDDILMEARILAVADVVESTASHRPYRPALGVEAALEEIEKNRGILYDEAVADACLRLFRVKGYQLPDTERPIP